MKRNEIRVVDPPYFKEFKAKCKFLKRSMNKQVHILIECYMEDSADKDKQFEKVFGIKLNKKGK